MCGNVFRLEILLRGIQLLIHVFVYLPVYLSTYLYISLPIYLCTHLYTYKLIHMCVYTYRTHTHTHERVLDRQRNKWVGINKCFHTHTHIGLWKQCYSVRAKKGQLAKPKSLRQWIRRSVSRWRQSGSWTRGILSSRRGSHGLCGSGAQICPHEADFRVGDSVQNR